jgi:hypothetical protein
MSIRPLFLAVCVLTSLFTACGPDLATLSDGSDSADQNQDELTALPCTLGSTGCDDLKLIKAHTTGTQHKRLDLAVELNGVRHNVYDFGTQLSRPLSFVPGSRVKLSGSVDRKATVDVDDLYLLQLYPDGAQTPVSAYFGKLTGSALYFNGVAVPQLGTNTNSHGALELDVTDLLPQNKAFKVRLTALNDGGSASASAVYLHDVKATTANSVEVFSAFDNGLTSLDTAALLKFFAAGTNEAALGRFAMVERTRTCNNLTGCTAWAPTTQTSYSGPFTAGTGGWYETPTSTNLPSGQVVGTLSLTTNTTGVRLKLKGDTAAFSATDCTTDGSSACALKSSTTTCYWRADSTQNCYSYDSDVQATASKGSLGLTFRVSDKVVIGESASAKSTPDATGSYQEQQYALVAATTAGAVLTLAVDGEDLKAVW